MAFDPRSVQKFTTADAPVWLQIGTHQAYVGYIADEEEGSSIGLAYIRFRAGVKFDFLWAYDEVAIVSSGSLTLRVGENTITARQGEFVYMPAGVRCAFDIQEDVEAVCVHYPTDGRAGREWEGPERLPAESEIHLVQVNEVWDW